MTKPRDTFAPLPTLEEIQEYLTPYGAYDLIWIKSPGGGTFAGTIAGCVHHAYPGKWKQVGFRQRKIMGWKLRHMLEHGTWGSDAPPDFVNHHTDPHGHYAQERAEVTPIFGGAPTPPPAAIEDNEGFPYATHAAPMNKLHHSLMTENEKAMQIQVADLQRKLNDAVDAALVLAGSIRIGTR